MAERTLYLDYAATTPVDPRVAAAMLPWLGEHYGNPGSRHVFGRRAATAVEAARAQVAELLGALSEEIVFTSGATEANNLAITGGARFAARHGRLHLITQRSEHSSVLRPLERLAREGFELTVLEVEPDGSLPPERLEAALRPDTALVSLMQVNNETGVIHPVAELAGPIKAAGALLHVDAVQAAGRLPLDVEALGVDLLTVSAHKLYGPQGVGALYLRRRPRVRIEPLLHGGGQESGLRSGTLATHQLVGMGEAFRLAGEEMATEPARLARLRRRLWDGLAALGGVGLNGRLDGAPHILNVSFAGVHGEALGAELGDALAASGSAACSSAQGRVSHVLRAMGVPEQLAHASLRLSLGRGSREQDLDYAVETLRRAVFRLREFSPLWRRHLQGEPLEKLYA